MKARRRKAATLSRSSAPKVGGRRKPSSTNADTTNALFKRERDELLEQQKATAEVLRLISASSGDLQRVFAAILENATRLCQANFGTLLLCEGDFYRQVAFHNAPPAFVEARRLNPMISMSGSTALARLAATKQPVHIADVASDPAYQTDPQRRSFVIMTGVRTNLAVPMLIDDKLIGAINIYRTEIRPFTDKQIELVKNFAAQAVIAIENTRLLNELRQRTDDLTESLEQQTASSQVLGVIAGSFGQLEPVFQTMLANAIRLCEAKFGLLTLREDHSFRMVAIRSASSDYAAMWKRKSLDVRDHPKAPLARLLTTKQLVDIADLTVESGYFERDPLFVTAVEDAGIRAMLAVPMLKESEVVGAFILYRQEPRPFSNKQIALVQNFSAQAVIAIENTRLLNELRQSLEQQTATAEVLSVISSSPGELVPVFKAMLENAVRICEAELGNLFLHEANTFRSVEMYGATFAHAEAWRHAPVFTVRDHPHFPLARLTESKQVIHIADISAERANTERDSRYVTLLDSAFARTMLLVPMLKDDHLVGAISLYRREVRPFTDKQIALVQNFAAQAVIAIENTRLLGELREFLQQQTATADVLKIISRSTFDLQTVLDTLVKSAAGLCGAAQASIWRPQGMHYRCAAGFGHSVERQAHLESLNLTPSRGTILGRVVLERRPIQVADVLADAEYDVAIARSGGSRALLGVPLLREGAPIGVLILLRPTTEPFNDRQIELAATFADQAVIAIENVRLFDEIQDKSRQLEVASQHKSQFLANMSHELRTPLNAILGYTELMADGIYGELPEKTMAVLKRLESNGRHLLGLINDVLDLSKIEAGQLVLELSDYSLEDIAQTVRSTLEPLAADKKLTFKVEVAAKLPPGHGDGRRLTQVVINLVGNAIKFTDAGEVVITARATDGSFHLSVQDTGPGISAADQGKLFQEFQQADNAITRKKGGTGLGLAISKRIIEMHGGKIWLESQVGQGSTFSFTVPVRVERQVEPA